MRNLSGRVGALLVLAVALATTAPVGGADAASAYNIITTFDGVDSGLPFYGAPTVDIAGNVYLTTRAGGPYNDGTVVMIAPGQPAAVMHTFVGADGSDPNGGVLYNQSNRRIFGTTCEGGANGYGVLFELDSGGAYQVLHSFDYYNDGECPLDAPASDGAGNLYGIAYDGGAGDGSGRGTVWEQASDGTFTVLHTFGIADYDGANPVARLIRGQGGLFYGTTVGNGNGSVFSIKPDGTYATLHTFDPGNDGDLPESFLMIDRMGNLYGTTSGGGISGGGTVYRLAQDGTFTVIHSFAPDIGGAYPASNLILLNNTLYGTTSSYGDANCSCGTVFEVGLDGSYYAVLHTFAGTYWGGPDGAFPYAGLASGSGRLSAYGSTFLYGDTYQGGTDGYGTVFQLRLSRQ